MLHRSCAGYARHRHVTIKICVLVVLSSHECRQCAISLCEYQHVCVGCPVITCVQAMRDIAAAFGITGTAVAEADLHDAAKDALKKARRAAMQVRV